MPGPDLSALDPYAVVGVAVLLVLVQTALLVGFLVPGGKAAVLTGVLAGVGQVPLALSWTGIVVAAVAGAGIGYLIGRRRGPTVLEHRLLRRHRARVDAAQDLMRRRAGFALVVGRSVAVLRATSPTLAGAAGVPARTFVWWNLVGAVGWGSATVGLGFLGGQSFVTVLGDLPVPVVIGVAGAVLVLVVVVRVASGRLRGVAPVPLVVPAD